MAIGWNTGGAAADPLYTPADAAFWDPQPTTMGEALDQLAAKSLIKRSGLTLAFTNGVTTTLWSYTLAEGEVMSARYTMTGGRLNGVTTERSLGLVDFTASRSVGGSAAVTSGSSNEVGTISGGTISASVSGNDVLVRIVYTQTGTLEYDDTVLLGSKPITQA